MNALINTSNKIKSNPNKYHNYGNNYDNIETEIISLVG